MSDKPTENPETDKPQENPVDPKPTQPTNEELMAQIEALTKSNETQKTEIAGLNKSYANKNTELTDLQKQHETEAETKAREAKELLDKQDQERNEFLTSKAEFEKAKTMFSVTKEALKHGYTEEDIEGLGFTSVEQVQKHKEWADAKISASKEEQTENISKALSGTREQIKTKPLEVKSYPSAIDKAFK